MRAVLPRRTLLAAMGAGLAREAMALPAAAGDASVRLATLEWAPYIGSRLPGEGWVGELVRAAFARAGQTVEYSYLPWARAMQDSRQGLFDGVLPLYPDLRRGEEFLLSQLLPGAAVGFCARVEDAPRLHHQPLAQLSGLRVGVVRGYLNQAEIDDPGGPWQRDEAPSDQVNLVKLAAGRVDLVVIDHLVAQHLLAQDPDLARRLRLLEPPFEVRCTTVAMSRATGRGEALVALLNQGLDALWADGTAGDILVAQGVDAALSMPMDRLGAPTHGQ